MIAVFDNGKAWLLVLVFVLSIPLAAAPKEIPTLQHDEPVGVQPVSQGKGHAHCSGGVANGYACTGINMLAQLELSELGGGSGADSWGWKDPNTGKYYALMGRSTGTSFVDITDPTAPVYLGNLPSTRISAPWRDVKTYANHAFVVADGIAQHGMQVFDLTRLRGVTGVQQFSADVIYNGISFAHNVAINEDSGFAYIIGGDQCAGGLHMVNIQNPKQPLFAGCFSGDGYSHDVQCVNYSGPDQNYSGREICVASNEDSLTIVDVTNKSAPVQISRVTYPDTGYTHQGWFTEDQRFFIAGDELDEIQFGSNARTLVFDLQNLAQAHYTGQYIASTSVIDHNLYVKGNHVYQANYLGGVRILEIQDASQAELREVAYFDTFPDQDSRNFQGAWNVYPFFDNGVLITSDINKGLFLLQADFNSELVGNPMNGTMSGQWVADNMPDQGMTLLVGQNNSGPFAFYAWYTYRNGEPFWIVGNAAIPDEGNGLVMPAIRLEGLGFFDISGSRASRIEIGTVEIRVTDCNEIQVIFELGAFGSGDILMQRLVGIEQYACIENTASAHHHGD